MRQALSLKEHLERREPTAVAAPIPSASPVSLLLKAGEMAEPVTVARTLVRYGLSLRKAHQVLNRLAEGHAVAVTLPEGLAADLSPLGVSVERHAAPDTVDIKAIRDKLGLSQPEFAARFCLELDTLQNWEQGRNTPDGRARTLLKIIEREPEVVDRVLAGG